jgi:hypothetical protein
MEYLLLLMEDGFTDEAGVALAEALTINKTLRRLLLNDRLFASDPIHTNASLGAQAYEAFGAMLRLKTSIELEVPPWDDDVDDTCRIFHQMLIEQRLNADGRGRLLASSQTPREDWVNALQELNAHNEYGHFETNCLYSLLRLNPSVCLLELNNSSNSVV